MTSSDPGSGGPRPPALLVALLRLTVPATDRDHVESDMGELFAARSRRGGTPAAVLWYARHTLRFAWQMRAAYARDTDVPTGGGSMGSMGSELRRGARRLRRAPVFTVVSLLTVAVGIGAFTSIWTVVDTVLVEPPRYENPDELIWIWRDYWFDLDRGWLGGPDVVWLREHTEAFDDVVAFRSGARNLTGPDGDHPERVRVTLASAGLFDLLGVPPVLGRGFLPGEDAADAPAVAVLGHDLWRTHFASDPAIVGTQIYLNGEATTVVGVAPEDFRFVVHSSLGAPSPQADLYAPLRVDLAALPAGGGSFAGLARVRDGAQRAQVDAAIDAVASDLDDIFGNRGLEMWGVGLGEDLVAGVRPALLALSGAAGLLLLVLAANLTSLFLGRASERDRELALLSALGADRPRLLQTAMSEAILVSAAGGAAGIGLAFVGVDLIRSFAPEQLPLRGALEVDGSVLLVAAGTTAVMGLGAGLLTATRSLREAVALRLREGSRGGGRGAARARAGLVVAQVALSVVLLVGSGLLTRAFARLLHSDPGFDGREALVFTLSLDPARYPDDADVADFDRRFRSAVSGLPGVRAVGASDVFPLAADASQSGMAFPGAPGNTGVTEEDVPLTDYFVVTAGYMDAAGMRVTQGRFIDDTDRADSPPVVVIDDQLARRFHPDGGAIGRTMSSGGDSATIVGVVDHVSQYALGREERPQVYFPMTQAAVATLRYVVAGAGDASAYAPEIRRVLDGIDPSAPVTDFGTLGGLVDRSLGRERLSLSLLSAYALGALVLSLLGIYGVVSNAVRRRVHEMGVRMALGADRGRVLGMVLGEGAKLTALGTVVGLVGALAGSRAVTLLVAGADPHDPVVYAGVVLLLGLVAAVATWLPARRAARIDPVEALRSD